MRSIISKLKGLYLFYFQISFHLLNEFFIYFFFNQLPECLCIHVQRKVYLENGMMVKRKDFVSVPEVLNMSPYSYSSTIKPEVNFSSLIGLYLE